MAEPGEIEAVEGGRCTRCDALVLVRYALTDHDGPVCADCAEQLAQEAGDAIVWIDLVDDENGTSGGT